MDVDDGWSERSVGGRSDEANGARSGLVVVDPRADRVSGEPAGALAPIEVGSEAGFGADVTVDAGDDAVAGWGTGVGRAAGTSWGAGFAAATGFGSAAGFWSAAGFAAATGFGPAAGFGSGAGERRDTPLDADAGVAAGADDGEGDGGVDGCST
ncbi:MAG: hypothetical protein AAFO29_03975, partial [Actinomycetota bacterium]